jgi:DNA-binding CsgD family transcriptional regulator
MTELRDARRQAETQNAFVDEAARRRLRELHELAMHDVDSSLDGRVLILRLAAIGDERDRQEAHDVAQRHRADIAIHRALARLRALESSAEASRRAPGELREACGFTRVMISSARGSRWMPDTMRRSDHADPDAVEFARFTQDDNEIPLARLMPETEMVRHRVPVLVPGIGSHAYQPLMRVTKSTSYVAAPIVTTQRVIGFLHADRFGQGNDVTHGDLDSIALFAAEFGVLFEHAALQDRVRRQRTNWTTMLRALIDDLESGPVTVPPPSPPNALFDGSASATKVEVVGSSHREPLTRRERDVVNLLATGATNQLIAQELVLTVDTVKTHVKHIMAKLHATSRADAVAKYLQSNESRRRMG